MRIFKGSFVYGGAVFFYAKKTGCDDSGPDRGIMALYFAQQALLGGLAGFYPAVRFKPHHGANSGQYGRSAIGRAWMTGRWLWIQKSEEAE